MNTPRHTPNRTRLPRLRQVVGTVTVAALALSIACGVGAPPPARALTPTTPVAIHPTLSRAVAHRALGRDAPPPPRPHMQPRVGATTAAADSSAAAGGAGALPGSTPDAADRVASTLRAGPRTPAYIAFASRASRTRGQPLPA